MLSGIGGQLLKDELHAALCEMKPSIVGVASAFVSSAGIEQLRKILKACGEPQCRLIAGIDKAITHPEALFTARGLGWTTRLGKAAPAVFHPKMLIAGHEVTDDGTIRRLCCVYVGSSNLTSGGLNRNIECGLIAKEAGCPDSAAIAFSRLWNNTIPATDEDLRDYAARFAEAARRRKAAELDDLGINDTETVASSPADLKALTPPDHPAVGVAFATAAWAGCQSFTGEYRFQLEFPRAAGVVVSQLLSLDRSESAEVRVFCPADESTRPMRYKYYQDNGMFRLNIQNDVPGVAWVRKHKGGIALIERGPQGGAPLRLRFVQPGIETDEVIRRSAALGTWGKTPTRVYGWY